MRPDRINRFNDTPLRLSPCVALAVCLVLVPSLANRSAAACADEAPDINSVPPDLSVPEMTEDAATAGRRIRAVHPDYAGTGVYHAVYLPTNWAPDRQFPVLVEFAGNGPYRGRFGDICTGRPENCSFGCGISAGRDFIWVCLPYLNAAGDDIVTRWWGDPPEFNPQPTVDYCLNAVPHLCETFGGDPDNVIVCGFSRGAIACNFIGLHDDRIASLWAAFVPYSHYDGVVTGWEYPGADRAAALTRLQRLGQRPQFIAHETSDNDRTNLAATQRYLESTGVIAPFTFAETGFRNHNDKWILRPSPARDKLREWIHEVVADR